MTDALTPAQVHNRACESAAQADCKCFCHGAGHQHDLVVRAASCSNTADLSSLLADLERLLGGFHKTARDVSTRSRPSRFVPTDEDIADRSLDVGRGATWLETMLVDEALHASYVSAARSSLAGSDVDRAARRAFVDRMTRNAIPVVGVRVSTHTVVDSHVWCSIVAEFAHRLVPASSVRPAPSDFGAICYPRRMSSRTSPRLARVRTAGLDHVGREYSAAASSVPPAERMSLLRLVGAATCPDLWHHPAAVRYCLSPLIDAPGWPLPDTTKVAVNPLFDGLRSRWALRKHW